MRQKIKFILSYLILSYLTTYIQYHWKQKVVNQTTHRHRWQVNSTTTWYLPHWKPRVAIMPTLSRRVASRDYYSLLCPKRRASWHHKNLGYRVALKVTDASLLLRVVTAIKAKDIYYHELRKYIFCSTSSSSSIKSKHQVPTPFHHNLLFCRYLGARRNELTTLLWALRLVMTSCGARNYEEAFRMMGWVFPDGARASSDP